MKVLFIQHNQRLYADAYGKWEQGDGFILCAVSQRPVMGC